LHAYIDGELAEDRRAVVAAYLRDHPAEARRLEAYRADGDALARLFSRAGDLRSAQSAPAPLRLRRLGGRVAATILIVAGTMAAGLFWLWQDRRDEALWARFGSEALAAHFALDRTQAPLSMTASLQDISELLAAKLNAPMRLHQPTDPAYALVGSQFLTGAIGRVAQLAFRDASGTLITMYFEPWPGKKDAPFRVVASQSNVTTSVWVDRGLGCAVTGALPQDQLERIGRALYAGLVKS
jgi:anti-sigma factor RsiW